MKVLDYSAGFPGAHVIKSAGYGGAVRYIGLPKRIKCTTRSEYLDFTSAGIGMGLVYEDVNTDWRNGFSGGKASGFRARDHANAIGFPADRPIYMAIDQEVLPTMMNTAVDYIRGARESLGGGYVTGVYGSANVLDAVRSARVLTPQGLVNICEYYWQTSAWSHGRRTEAHLFQRLGTVNVGGVNCDLNDVLKDDWGQHNWEGGISMADMTQVQFNQFMDGYNDSKTRTVHEENMNLTTAQWKAVEWAGDARNFAETINNRTKAWANTDGLLEVNVVVTPEQLTTMISGISANIIAALPPDGVSTQDVHDIVADVVGSITLHVNQ